MDSQKSPNYVLNEQIYESSDKTIKIFKVRDYNFRQGKDTQFNILQSRYIIRKCMRIIITSIKY